MSIKFLQFLKEKMQGIGKETGIGKLVLSNPVSEIKPCKEFIERMRAQGYKVETTETGVIITGDNLKKKYDELQKAIEDYLALRVVDNKQT